MLTCHLAARLYIINLRERLDIFDDTNVVWFLICNTVKEVLGKSA